jgi:hypothetical protein
MPSTKTQEKQAGAKYKVIRPKRTIESAKTKRFFDPKLTRTANLQEAPEKRTGI